MLAAELPPAAPAPAPAPAPVAPAAAAADVVAGPRLPQAAAGLLSPPLVRAPSGRHSAAPPRAGALFTIAENRP
jgi:hypothetical protein